MCVMLHVTVGYSCITVACLNNTNVDTASCNNKPTAVLCGCSSCFTMLHVTSHMPYIFSTAAS